MRSSLLPLLLSVLILGPTAESHAQTDQDEEILSIDFTVIAWGESIREPIYYVSDSEYIPLRMTTTSRSRVHRYNGPNPIKFFTRTDAGEYAPAARTVVDENSDRVLLLFSKDRDATSTQSRYRVIGIDDSEDEFPRDSYRFINWTQERVIGKLGSRTFALEPSSSTIILPRPTENNQISLQLAELKDNNPGIIYSGIWPIHTNFRKLVFLLPSKTGTMEKVKIVVISDYVPVE